MNRSASHISLLTTEKPVAVRLRLQLLPDPSPDPETREFYSADEWTRDSEAALIQRLHDLIAVVRPMGKTIHLVLNVEVTDRNLAMHAVTTKINDKLIINHKELSLREIEVLGLIMLGCTNKDIAEKLFISCETVKSHRKHILAKTGAKNTAALINYYHQTFFEK